MREIERIINKKFIMGEMPSGKQICEQQLIKLIDDIEKVKVNDEGNRVLPTRYLSQTGMAFEGRPDKACSIDGVQPLLGILQQRSGNRNSQHERPP